MEKLIVWCEAFVCIASSIMCAYFYRDVLGTAGWIFSIINLWNAYYYYKKYEKENIRLTKKMNDLGDAYAEIDRLNDDLEKQTRW